jgi:hypothetical protein
MHETDTLTSSNNTIRLTLTGNEIRGIILIFRDMNGARVDLTDANCGVMRFRLDNRVLWTMKPSADHRGNGGVLRPLLRRRQVASGRPGAGFTRETGVYVLPRFRDPGSLGGEFWLQTVEQSLLQIEFNGGDGATTLEVIYDNLAVSGALPPEFEGI